MVPKRVSVIQYPVFLINTRRFFWDHTDILSIDITKGDNME